MKYKVGFIGCGNMASAMISGIVENKVVAPEEIVASNRSQKKLIDAKERYGIEIAADNVEVAKNSDVIILAVKPIYYHKCIKQIRKHIDDDQIIISIAPGFELEKLSYWFGEDRKIIRTMPNTPAMVSEGMTAVCPNENVEPEEVEMVVNLLQGFGKAEYVPEHIMEAVVAVSGSSPAYVYMFIEAMADAAVAEGMGREQAYRFAAQAVLGSAKMVLETGLHPGALKDQVCSPGGTTIVAVRELERRGFRSAVMEAMAACAKKCRKK